MTGSFPTPPPLSPARDVSLPLAAWYQICSYWEGALIFLSLGRLSRFVYTTSQGFTMATVFGSESILATLHAILIELHWCKFEDELRGAEHVEWRHYNSKLPAVLLFYRRDNVTQGTPRLQLQSYSG